MRPGAVRVSASGGMSGGRVSAFRNEDGVVAVQVINTGASTGNVVVKVSGGGGFSMKKATAWATDNSRDCDVVAGVAVGGDGGVSLSVGGRSMVTVVLEGE